MLKRYFADYQIGELVEDKDGDLVLYDDVKNIAIGLMSIIDEIEKEFPIEGE